MDFSAIFDLINLNQLISYLIYFMDMLFPMLEKIMGTTFDELENTTEETTGQ